MTGLLQQFAAQVAKAPDHIAIDEAAAGRLTYRQLDAASDAQARALIAQGLRPGMVVGLRMQRSAALVVAILAVLKAQALYFPLGVAQPATRLAMLLSRAGAAFVLSDADQPALPPGPWAELRNLQDAPEVALPAIDMGQPACLFHTSGTTGLPKLMRIGQPGILRMAQAPDYVTITAQDRIALLANPAFDALNFEIWAALLNGATLVPFGRDAGLDPDLLAVGLGARRVTGAFFTTSLFHLLAELRPDCLLGLDWAVLGGEAASAAHIHRLFAAQPGSALVLTNGYGPTECTTFAVAHRMTAADWARADHPALVPIGQPLRDTPVLVVMPDTLVPVASGEWGELLIGGSGLAEGYLDQPDETAAKFVQLDGRRYYRSGDLARWHEGVLHCGGRLDQQVKIRGHRIELAEIETRLLAHPQVNQAAAALQHGRLCAFVVAEPGLTAADLRRDLAISLPDYMLPQSLTFLARLPLTANGKLDRRALITAETRLWEGEIPPGQSLLQLGGDSLIAARLVTEWRARGLQVSLSELLSARPLADLLQDAQGNRQAVSEATLPPPRQTYPAASEQRRLWLAQEMQPASTAYSIPLRFDFETAPDQAAMQRALTTLFARHAVLRARFAEVDGALQVQINPPRPLALEHPESEAAFFGQAFDLASGCLLRAGVIGSRLLVLVHHIVVDGAALNILLADLAALYDGQDLPPAPDYSGYPLLQAAVYGSPAYQGRRLDRQRSLGAAPDRNTPALHLPAPMAGRLRHVLLPPAVLTALQDLARSRGQSLFSLLLAAYALTLARAGHGPRLSIGLPVGLRPPGYEAVVGMFVNTQICRLDLDPGLRPEDVLTRVDAEVQAMRQGHDVAYDHLVADLRAAGQHGAPFETMFVLENTDYHLPGLAARFVAPEKVDPRFPLTLFATVTEAGLSCQIEHDLALFDPAAVDRIETLFTQTARALATGLPDLAQLEDPPGLMARIGRAIALWPDAPAAISGTKQLSFAELDLQSAALAAALQQQGAQAGDRIGLSLRPGLPLLVGLLAILRLGAAYVPLDPDYPPARRNFMVQDAGLRLVIATDAEDLPEGLRIVQPLGHPSQPGPQPWPAERPEAIAYVIYTSGSTGQPKGVCVNHHSLANYLDHVAASYFAPFPLQGAVVSTSLNFDATVTSLLGPLCQGLPAIILPAADMAALTDLALGAEPLLFKLTPSHLVAFLSYAAGRRCETAHLLVVGGEQLPTHLAQSVLDLLPNAQIVNEYGPTEATVGCITAWASRMAGVPDWRGAMVIGRPMQGAEIRLLHPDGREAAPGEEGEIVIRGVCVTQGYLNRPDLTASRFAPLDGHPCYRTGDRAMRLPNGDMAYLGRFDDQVKLNGFRIEPGEVEAALCALPDVQAAAVMVHEGQLLAFYTGTALPADLQEPLGQALPAHMRPSRLFAVAAMPLTPNGKLDKAALIAGLAAPISSPISSLPISGSSDTRERLSALFTQVLGHALEPEQHFFDAGAGSLALMKVHALARQDLAPDLALVAFFRHPTLVQLADHIDAQRPAPMPTAPAVMTSDDRSGDIAIIGMAAGLPGAEDLADLWQMIREGRSAIRLGPAKGPGHVNAVSSLARPLAFDAEHFRIPPREAGLMDPQQRHLLMGAVQALDHAGLDAAGLRIGLIVGSSENTYHQTLQRNGAEDLSAYALALLQEKDFLASRIAHLLDLRGPALTVQTACSSSLVAVHQACQALRAGEAEAMLAGGCNISLTTLEGYQHQPGHIFSADGHCAPFSAAANGTVPANGWGLVVLRPLAAAQTAGDRVLAIIKGSAINNDGSNKVGFTAPSATGQTEVIRAAMAQAGIDADRLGYVETHGTATALGDPIEVEALSDAYGPGPQGAIAIGSIKSQIGHMGAGAGVAGLIRVVLAMLHQTLPPTLGFVAPSPAIDFARLALRVQGSAAPWPQDRPYAGVSSFGMGGTNAHLVLSPAPDTAAPAPTGAQVLVLHGRTAALVRAQAQALALRLEQGSSLPGLAAACLRGARDSAFRAAICCTNVEDAIALLHGVQPVSPASQDGPMPQGARAVADAWLNGLSARHLPRPEVPAAWDLPPRAFELTDHLHPAALPGAIATAMPVATSRRLPWSDWFQTPVWQRVPAAPAAPTSQAGLVLDVDDNWPETLLPLLRDKGAALARVGQSLTLRARPDADGQLPPDLAMLSGFLRAVAAELPGLALRLVATDAATPLPALQGSGFAHYLHQRGKLWQAGHSAAAPTPESGLAIRPGCYLITGGSGGIAQSLARGLLQTPGTEVILASRSGRALPGTTGLALDITDAAAVAAFARERNGQPLAGVIHAAGLPGGGAVQLMTPAALAATLAPKRQGAEAIIQHLAPLTQDFILFCSSLSAVVGVAGQADYAAANAWLDARAEDWSAASGPRLLSVNWPAWRGIGMSGKLMQGSGKMADLARALDEGALSEAEGWQVFQHALRLGLPQLIVSPLPLARLQSAPADAAPTVAAPESEALDIADVFARFLGLDGIDPEVSFYDLGGDSLLGLDVLEALANQGHDLPASLLSGPFSVNVVRAALAIPAPAQGPVVLRNGLGPPLVLIHPIGGDVVSYRALASQVAPGRPVLAIEDAVLADPDAPDLDIDSRARAYLQQVEGRFSLAGWSFGGLVAFAMARIAPDRVLDLTLIDPPAPQGRGPVDPRQAEADFLAEITHRKHLGLLPEDLSGDAPAANPYLARLLRAFARNSQAMARWQPQPLPQSAPPTCLILADGQGEVAQRQADWLHLVPKARTLRLAGDHFSILQPPEVGALTDAINSLHPMPEVTR
ncbi:non-ribosomal peptide synthetase [Gemmobacter serpentinus]|uniref:non-ribosomal peptide synthetase n=1 Tax=Gemmobacter serpentinus TaxID=2652247 RepID=UPI0018658069|nr:non-ribosomal peptide synthetase [Gemmobacter serpentinus]